MSRFWTFIFRAVIVLVLAGHVFYMYCLMRAWTSFGFEWRAFVLGLLFASAMLIPFLWVAWLPDIPETLTLRRARRRFARYQCPACAYNISGITSEACPECGTALIEPPGYEWSWRTLRRFLALNAIALLLGIGLGESTVSMDEAAFRREVQAFEQSGSTGPYIRDRAWPNGAAYLRYTESEGVTFEQ